MQVAAQQRPRPQVAAHLPQVHREAEVEILDVEFFLEQGQQPLHVTAEVDGVRPAPGESGEQAPVVGEHELTVLGL